MQQLFDFAFARLDHAEAKRREFGESWKQYISQHPWDIDVRNVTPTTFEILAVTREQAPVQLSLAFSDWLATIRAALDNGLYAWVASATEQNPPPLAERIQYPICSTAKEYASQRKRLSGVPVDILDKVEAAQPYQLVVSSISGPGRTVESGPTFGATKPAIWPFSNGNDSSQRRPKIGLR